MPDGAPRGSDRFRTGPAEAQAPLAVALRLSGLGLSVIPIPRPDARFDGKTPALKWADYQTRRAGEDEIRRWFSTTKQNIGVVTGAISGVVVIDADSAGALAWIRRRLPFTPWQTKTARGFHLWYQHPGSHVPNRAKLETEDGKLDLDVRADHGFVVAPASVHATGARYEFAGDWSIPKRQLPRFWPGWLRRPTRPTPAHRPPASASGDLVDRARRYLARVPVPEIGGGSDSQTLYLACRLVRGFGLSEADTIGLLWDWAGGRPGWTWAWVAAKVRNAGVYGTEPVGALR